MASCFLCNETIEISKLKYHLRAKHKFEDISVFKCIYKDCCQVFSNYNCYRVHLNRHYKRKAEVSLEILDFEIHCESAKAEVAAHQQQQPTTSTAVLQSIICTQAESNSKPKPIDTMIHEEFAKFYGNPGLPLNASQMVYSFANTIIREKISKPFITETKSYFAKIGLASNVIDEYLSLVLPIVECKELTNFNSHYKRMKRFKEAGAFIEPVAHFLGTRRDLLKVRGIRQRVLVPCYSYLVPLRATLKAFFSLGNMLSETLKNVDDLQKEYNRTGIVTNFVQSISWKHKLDKFKKNEIVLPLFLYMDEYETGNVLGSHSNIHKMGGVYASVPCIPESRSSALSSIFLAQIFHASDKSFGNAVLYSALIKELNYLSTEGIFFDLPDFKGNIRFQLGLLVGDNLGIHSLISFTEGFNSNFACRVCKMHKKDMRVATREDITLLRNNDNYTADLALNNPKLTGINEPCVFLQVRNFDLFESVAHDFAHDIHEGVARYVMTEVLYNLIVVEKCLSLRLFNAKLQLYDFGVDSDDRPMPFDRDHLKSHVRTSASEMGVLIRHLPMLIGHLVKTDNEYWALYLSLRRLFEILHSQHITKATEACVRTYVEELNDNYMSVTGRTLPNKFHHLVHYPRTLSLCGPASKIWTLRFESYHRNFKISARASTNRRNLTFSLATRHQLTFNDMVLNRKLPDILTSSKAINNFVPLSESTIVYSYLNLEKTKPLVPISWFKLSSVRYSKGMPLIYDNHYEGEMYELDFIVIDKIYLYDSQKVIISGPLLKCCDFDEHLFAYEIDQQCTPSVVVADISQLLNLTPHHICSNINGKKYVTLRTYI